MVHYVPALAAALTNRRAAYRRMFIANRAVTNEVKKALIFIRKFHGCRIVKFYMRKNIGFSLTVLVHVSEKYRKTQTKDKHTDIVQRLSRVSILRI